MLAIIPNCYGCSFLILLHSLLWIHIWRFGHSILLFARSDGKNCSAMKMSNIFSSSCKILLYFIYLYISWLYIPGFVIGPSVPMFYLCFPLHSILSYGFTASFEIGYFYHHVLLSFSQFCWFFLWRVFF